MTNIMSIGSRMKRYEEVTQGKLLRRTPVIIRVDGKTFHTFVKRFNSSTDESMINSPFSYKLNNLMCQTAMGMCMRMQNAIFAYTQSDEISFFLRDWDRHETEQWFDAKIQKIASVSGGMASAYFNYFITKDENDKIKDQSYIGEVALFDSRVFNLPFEEVTNYFIWRQQDATRNSINMLGRYYYSQKQLYGKNTSQVQDMLMEKNINWNDLDIWKKRGTCIIPHPDNLSCKLPYLIDREIPIFTKNREYIEKYLDIEEKL